MLSEKTRLYVLSIGGTAVVVGGFFVMQVLFVLPTFKPVFAIIPLLLSVTIGALIGNIQILRMQIRKKERIFHAITDNAREFSYFQKSDGSYEYVSPAAQALTGYPPERFYADKNLFASLVHEADRPLWERHLHTIASHPNDETLDFRIRHKNGTIIWINHNCSLVYEKGQMIGIRSVNANITQKKHDEIAIKKLVEFDTLTGLPNRFKIMQHIDTLMADEIPFTLMFIDLNRFKTINDTLGHPVGDQVLIQVADQLTSCRSEDFFVGRLGGDEFIACKPHKRTRTDIEAMADNLLQLIAHDYSVDDYTFYIGASIGIAFFPGDSHERHELLICADKAMYNAKLARNANIVYFNEINSENALQQVLLEKDLRNALQHKELEVYLQPKVHACSGEIVSYEALVRWQKTNVMLPPDQFIPIAEETGLIKEITMFMLNSVFAIASDWHRKGLLNTISINISMIDFMSDHFIGNVKKALRDHHADARWFELEITESIFLESSHIILEKIRLLTAMGFKIALDDFGTGYSSLAYLTTFPIDIIKIDKVFIAKLHDDYEKNVTLLRGMVDITASLGYRLVCEGVERKEDAELLITMGCPTLQGYYFYEPMPVEAAERLGVIAPKNREAEGDL